MALQNTPRSGSAGNVAGAAAPPPPLLEVRGLRKEFVSGGLFGSKRTVAVQDVSFTVDRGEAVAIVGESGSGKSTIARMLLRLTGSDGGEIRLEGRDVLAEEPRGASLSFRGRVQMVFQDPFGSLNPVHSIAHHLARPLLRHGRVSSGGASALNPAKSVGSHVEGPLQRLVQRPETSDRVRKGGSAAEGRAEVPARARPEDLRARALELLRLVGLEPAEDFVDRYPYELSGGQRQRVAIARALAVEPDLLVADEPTSMLDVSIRTGVLNLLSSLKSERGLGIVLITHDLASARYLSDRILVLYRGRIVEDGESGVLIESPLHPYTKALLASIADSHGSGMSDARSHAAQASPTLPAVPASKAFKASKARPEQAGCPFAPRCPEVMELCRTQEPRSRAVAFASLVGDAQSPAAGRPRHVRCHLYPEDAAPSGS